MPDNNVAIVTAAGRGIGAAIAFDLITMLEMLKRGCRVMEERYGKGIVGNEGGGGPLSSAAVKSQRWF